MPWKNEPWSTWRHHRDYFDGHAAGSYGGVSENVVATLVTPYFDGQVVELLIERGSSKDMQMYCIRRQRVSYLRARLVFRTWMTQSLGDIGCSHSMIITARRWIQAMRESNKSYAMYVCGRDSTYRIKALVLTNSRRTLIHNSITAFHLHLTHPRANLLAAPWCLSSCGGAWALRRLVRPLIFLAKSTLNHGTTWSRHDVHTIFIHNESFSRVCRFTPTTMYILSIALIASARSHVHVWQKMCKFLAWHYIQWIKGKNKDTLACKNKRMYARLRGRGKGKGKGETMTMIGNVTK